MKPITATPLTLSCLRITICLTGNRFNLPKDTNDSDFYVFNEMKVIILASAVALSLLSGCAQVGPDFNQMTGAYSATVDQHNRNSLLVNLIRAANRLPTQFTTIPSVIGTGTITTQAGLSANLYSLDPTSAAGFFSAASGSSSSLSASLAAQRQFSFTLSALDNELFTQGFLTDITIDRLRLLSSSEENSKDLLYTLVVSSIEINPQSKQNIVFRNDMVEDHYPKFKARMQFLVDAGLTTELSSNHFPVGLPMTRKEVGIMSSDLAKSGNLQTFTAIQFFPISGTKDQYQAYQAHSGLKYCLSLPPTANNIASIFSKSIRCTTDENQENLQVPDASLLEEYKHSQLKDLTFNLHLRSTREVFQYLGQVIKKQIAGNDSKLTYIRDVESNGKTKEVPLIVVRKGTPPIGTEVIASADYFNENYYIPKDDSGLSAEVIDLLSVMVTLNKIPGSIPVSPGVLIR